MTVEITDPFIKPVATVFEHLGSAHTTYQLLLKDHLP